MKEMKKAERQRGAKYRELGERLKREKELTRVMEKKQTEKVSVGG